MENANPLSPPESPTSPNSRRVRELNKLLESLKLVVPPTISEPSCLEGELGLKRLFKEMKNEDVEKEVEKEITEEKEGEEICVDCFDKFPTKDGLAYHKYLLHDPCLFFHRRLPIIGGSDPFSIRNFTDIADFLVVEDVGSAIDNCLSHVLLVKDNKIDLLVPQYEQFTILEEESIDSGFARFNTIITSLKALDEGFFRKNYVRKFLRALHPKWRAKVTAIEESKDLSTLALDELIGNLKVHEFVMEKFSKIYRGKKERVKSIALKAKKESSDDETLTFRSDDEEYVMAVRNFKKCGDPNHLIGDFPKPPRNKDQKAFIGGSWSDSENDAEDKTNDETCLMAQSSNEITLNSSYYSDNASSLNSNKISFSTFKAYNGGNVVFRSNFKEKLIGHSQNSKAYIVLNKHIMKVEESLNVTFDESPSPTKLSPLVDDDVGEEEAVINITKVVINNNEEDESIEVDKVINIKESKNHLLDQVIGDLNQRTLRS
ncbi:zf-CCHC domain-containing protein [Tanacetum coccineum]